MKVGRSEDQVRIEMSPAESRVLLEELANLRGGSKMPKIRQLCEGVELILKFWAGRKSGGPA